jgi:hypothetical protein
MPAGRKLRAALLVAALAATLGAVYWASRLPSDPAAGDLVVSAEVARGARQRGPVDERPGAGALDLNRLQRPKSAEPTDDLFGARDFTPKPKPVQRPIAQPAAVAAAPPAPAAPPPPPPPCGPAPKAFAI